MRGEGEACPPAPKPRASTIATHRTNTSPPIHRGRRPRALDLRAEATMSTAMPQTYDVIIVGARCAGSPTAALLARKGYRVLVVDRAAFPSDTVSTHVVHPLGVAALARWGSTLVPSRSRERRARRRRRWPTVRGGPSWTSCWSTPPPRPARRSAQASRWRTCWSRTDASSASREDRKTRQRSPSAPKSSSGRMAGTRW